VKGDRELVFEIVTRLRESEQEAKRFPEGSHRQEVWLARARAFDECYTELKGRGLDSK
jgi:hypothetical protein